MAWLFSKHETTPAPETLAHEYMTADADRQTEIEGEMLQHHGIRRYRNGTWGDEEEYYCGLCGSMRELSHFPH